MAETDGAGSYRKPVFKIPYVTGDYAADWSTFTAPTPSSIANGSMVIAYNSNTTSSKRMYIYLNAQWVYLSL